MKIKQIHIRERTERPLQCLEQQINEALKQVFGQDVKLGICGYPDLNSIKIHYTALILHSATRGNRLTQIKLIESKDTTCYGPRKEFIAKVNQYMNQYDLEPTDLEYLCIPTQYSLVMEVAMIKHRKRR